MIGAPGGPVNARRGAGENSARCSRLAGARPAPGTRTNARPRRASPTWHYRAFRQSNAGEREQFPPGPKRPFDSVGEMVEEPGTGLSRRDETLRQP